jgi:catechol 2,3-dioxygenase
MSSTSASRPSPGAAISHLVLNVRDIEASHRFYTEVMGFEHCGTLDPSVVKVDMRFYRGSPDHHHDLALMQVRDPAALPDVERWGMLANRSGINHVAIAYPDRDAWLAQLAHLRESGVEFLVRANHGMTHSAYIADPDGNGIEVLYDLPREVWEGDVDAALSYFQPLPVDGPESLEDDVNYRRFAASTGR